MKLLRNVVDCSRLLVESWQMAQTTALDFVRFVSLSPTKGGKLYKIIYL